MVHCPVVMPLELVWREGALHTSTLRQCQCLVSQHNSCTNTSDVICSKTVMWIAFVHSSSNQPSASSSAILSIQLSNFRELSVAQLLVESTDIAKLCHWDGTTMWCECGGGSCLHGMRSSLPAHESPKARDPECSGVGFHQFSTNS